MPNQWTEAKLFKFLRLYKRYECLWNPYSPEHGNSDAKSEAFSQILCEMNVYGLTVNECLNQIKHIRETYKQEQQRLESLAFLGGRSYSNLLWYPLMNSMLSKVIQDEEKLNQATDNVDLVVVPKCLPFDSTDHRSQRDLNRIGYGRRVFSWNHNEATISPYLSNSNFSDYITCYPDSNIPNNSIGMYTPNEHINSCPTCGYSSGSSCNCFLINNARYHADNIGQRSSQTQINYRPRTSYNYSNGILEINSAVRIPLSQPSPNCGYSNLIESIMPEEPEYNLNPVISSNHQLDVQTVGKEDESSMKCSDKSSDCNDKKYRGNDECECQKMLDHAAHYNSSPSDLTINKNDASVKNIRLSLKKSKRTKGNVDEIVCSQNLLGVIGVTQNSIRKSIKHEKSVADNNESLQANDHENPKKDIQSPRRVESEKLFNVGQEILTLNPKQQSIINIKTEKAPESDVNMTETNAKVEEISGVALENGQPTKENITSKILEPKPQWNEDLIQCKEFQTNCKLSSPESPKKKTRYVSNQQSSLGVINDGNEKTSDAETAQDVVKKSKSIIKHNLRKMVIDFIDKTLNKQDEMSAVDAGQRLILKKAAKDLQALEKESNCICDGKLAKVDYDQQSEQKCKKSNFCNKTICWREPIEESLNIVPYELIRSQVNTSNYNENVLTGRSIQLNKGTGNCFRMMAGADFDINTDIEQSDLLRQQGTRSKSKIITAMEKHAFSKNQETRCENLILPTCKEHLVIAIDKIQQRDDENDCKNVTDILKNKASQTKPEEYVLDEVRSVRVVNEAALNHSNTKVARDKNIKLLSANDIKNEKCPIIIDKLCQAEESVDLKSQNIDEDGKIIQIETNSNTKSCKDHVDNSEGCNPCSTLRDVMEMENGVTIHISVGTSASRENEIVDKAVNKITYILRKTLDKNGYAIEKKQFFTEKNLITNDNGEINRKLIENKAVWKTELRNIIGHLMKHNKVGDSITFKVKTIILPVTSESLVTAKGAAKFFRGRKRLKENHEDCDNSTGKKAQYENSGDMRESFFKDGRKISTAGEDEYIRNAKNSKSKPKVNHMAPINDSINVTERGAKYKIPRRKLPDKRESRACNEQFRDFDSDMMLCTSTRDLQFKKQLLKNEMRKCSKKSRHVIPKCVLKNVTELDKILFNVVNKIVLPRKDLPHALWKLLKYLIKFRKKFQSGSKKNEKSLHVEAQEKNCAIINDPKFQQNHHRNDSVPAGFCNKLSRNLYEDIDVYLCTEISQEDESPMLKKAGCGYYSDSSILLDDVNENSLSTETTIQENSEIKSATNGSVHKTDSKANQNGSEWESFSDSDEEVKIVKQFRHRNKFIRQISKDQFKKIVSAERHALTGNFNQSNRFNDHVLIDTSRKQSRPAVYALTKTTKNTSRYREEANKVELLDTIIQPSNKEQPMPSRPNGLNNISSLQNNCKNIDVLSSNNQNISEKELRSSEEASLCCPEFEEEEEAKNYQMRNRGESEEGQSLLETKLRIAADNHIKSCCTGDQTHNVCTPICDVTSRLRLCTIIKSPDKTSTPNRHISSNNICCCDDMNKLKNVGGAHFKPHIKPSQKNVMIGDASVRLTTVSCQTEPQSRVLSQDCKDNTTSSLEISRNETYTKDSVAIDSRIITTSADIKPSDNVDHSKSTTVQSNTQNSGLNSMEIPAFGGGSLILEIKMPQPLFSIELKRGNKDPEKTGVQGKQISWELLQQNNHHADISLDQESVIESISKHCGISTQQQTTNCLNESTSTNPVSGGVQKMTDQGTELLSQRNEEEGLSCGTQTSQICKMERNLKKGLSRVCLDNSTSSTSIAFDELKKNTSTSFDEKWDFSDFGQCNSLTETLRSLKNDQNPCEISSNELSVNDSIYNSSDETKSMTIETLIGTVETSLQQITDPIIHQKLVDTIKYMRDQGQNQIHSSKQNPPQDHACETLKRTLKKNRMEIQIESKDNIRPQSLLSMTKDNECQKPCKSYAVSNTNSCRNIEGIVADVNILQDQNKNIQNKEVALRSPTKMLSPMGHTLTKKEVADQISKNESRVKLPIAEKFYCRNSASKIGTKEETRYKSPLSKSDSESQMLKIEDPNNTLYENLITSENEWSELPRNSRLMSTLNYSSNEMASGVEEAENDSGSCDSSINERLKMTPQLQDDENDEFSKYYCCRTKESTEVDINAFASMVASRLRGLSTEAALRSQQRIQTLISNSRLELEKNKKHR